MSAIGLPKPVGTGANSRVRCRVGTDGSFVSGRRFFFTTPSSGYMSHGAHADFPPPGAGTSRHRVQFFGVCDRSFRACRARRRDRHRTIGTAPAVSRCTGVSLILKSHAGIFLPAASFIGDATILFLLLVRLLFRARDLMSFTSELPAKARVRGAPVVIMAPETQALRGAQRIAGHSALGNHARWLSWAVCP